LERRRSPSLIRKALQQHRGAVDECTSSKPNPTPTKSFVPEGKQEGHRLTHRLEQQVQQLAGGCATRRGAEPLATLQQSTTTEPPAQDPFNREIPRPPGDRTVVDYGQGPCPYPTRRLEAFIRPPGRGPNPTGKLTKCLNQSQYYPLMYQMKGRALTPISSEHQ